MHHLLPNVRRLANKSNRRKENDSMDKLFAEHSFVPIQREASIFAKARFGGQSRRVQNWYGRSNVMKYSLRNGPTQREGKDVVRDAIIAVSEPMSVASSSPWRQRNDARRRWIERGEARISLHGAVKTSCVDGISHSFAAIFSSGFALKHALNRQGRIILTHLGSIQSGSVHVGEKIPQLEGKIDICDGFIPNIYTLIPLGPESAALPTNIPHSEVLYLAFYTIPVCPNDHAGR